MRADDAAMFAENGPKILLRRWCTSPRIHCSDFQFIDIHFDVEVHYKIKLRFSIKAYGREAKSLNPKRFIRYINAGVDDPPVPEYNETKALYIPFVSTETEINPTIPWFRQPSI